MAHFSRNHIQNIDNYKNTFDETTNTIFNKYLLIIKEYLEHSNTNIYIQNEKYHNYVLKRGISTLNHIFKLMLIYTKNLDMVYYNCQKSYMYYIEFIGQIGDENHSFLQLNSKDASLFVYKKTIFEINNDIRLNYSIDNSNSKSIKELDNLIKIHNLIINKLIENYKINELVIILDNEFSSFMNKILKLNDINESNENNKNNKNINNNDSKLDNNSKGKLDCIIKLTSNYNKKNIIEISELFLKKIKKIQNPNCDTLEKLLIDQDSIIHLSPIKYVNYLVSRI